MFTSFQSTITAPTTSKVSPAGTQISNREQEVLYLIAFEHTAEEIASKLFISYETVNSHRKNIKTKLGAKNTAGMVRVAYERRLLITESI